MKGSSLGRERETYRSGPLRCGLQAADWPIVAAVAATLLIVATLPQNSTVLADQIVAGHLRSLAMFASAWAHARAEVQRGVSGTVLLQFHRLLHAAS